MAAALTLQPIPASAADIRASAITSGRQNAVKAADLAPGISPDVFNLNGRAELSSGLGSQDNGLASALPDLSLIGRDQSPAAQLNADVLPAVVVDAVVLTGNESAARPVGTALPADAVGFSDTGERQRPAPAAAEPEDLGEQRSPLARNVWEMALRLGFLKSKFYGDVALEGLPPDVAVSPKVDYKPLKADQDRARREYLLIADNKEEILSTPTALEKAMHKDLQRASFPIAQIDVVLTDIANGIETRVAEDILHDVISALVGLRGLLFKEYAAIRDRIAGDRMSFSPARAEAIRTMEAWHERGLAVPNLEAKLDDAWQGLRRPYQAVLAAALGAAQATPAEVRRLVERFEQTVSFSPKAHAEDLGRIADRSLARAERAAAKTAEAIYEGAVGEAKDAKSSENIRHMLARQQAIGEGTVFPVLTIEKQMRPTCTVNTLQSMLAALGVRRDLMQLVLEARRLLNDPFIGITTSFNPEMQLRLFKHYGPVLQVQGYKLFETLISSRKVIKIGIDIGDPIYQHSLLLEGLYMLDGELFVSMRDAMSHYPIRMEISKFASVYLPANSLQIQSVYPDAPRP